MLISKEIEFDMGHRIPNHKSKCRNIHGHRYKVQVRVDSRLITKSGASDEGMVMDYGDLKKLMVQTIDHRFDHGFMVYMKDPLFKYFQIGEIYKHMKIVVVDFVPTAENIARYIYELLNLRLKKMNVRLVDVTVWETPTCQATYARYDRIEDNILINYNTD